MVTGAGHSRITLAKEQLKIPLLNAKNTYIQMPFLQKYFHRQETK